MAEVLFRPTAGDVHEARSAGSSDPTQLADVVVTMGCGDACQYIPGRRYVDRELDDPAWKSRAELGAIRDEIAERVDALLTGLDERASR
jgi:arsenate reductase